MNLIGGSVKGQVPDSVSQAEKNDEQVYVKLPIDVASQSQSSDRESEKQMMGEEYLRELAFEISQPDETHVDMSSLKN